MRLEEPVVHLYHFDLNGDAQTLDWLSPDELERAERMRAEPVRRRFVRCRNRLREILGSYLGEHPRMIHLRYTAEGKPYLPDHPLSFNLSHSRDCAVIAVGPSIPLGIDVEATAKLRNIDATAAQVFSASEQVYLNSLPPLQKQTAFYDLWTAKEALLKAIGTGFAVDARQFSLAIDSDRIRLDAAPSQAGGCAQWHFYRFYPHPEFTAALAYQADRAMRIIHG